MTATEAAELTDQWTPLLIAIVRTWSRRYPWLADDFASDSAMRLWRAALRHDPARGSFPALLKVVVYRACLNRVQRERRRNLAAFQKAAPLTDADGRTAEAVDLLAASGHAVGTEAEVAELLDVLTDEERELVERRYLDGERITAIAAAEDVSHQAIQQRCNKLLATMRTAAGE